MNLSNAKEGNGNFSWETYLTEGLGDTEVELPIRCGRSSAGRTKEVNH